MYKGRDTIEEIVEKWTPEEREKFIVTLRSKGYACNTESEIINAYLGVYCGGNLLTVYLSVVLIIIIIFSLYYLIL